MSKREAAGTVRGPSASGPFFAGKSPFATRLLAETMNPPLSAAKMKTGIKTVFHTLT
jgi:hypothetical protein